MTATLPPTKDVTGSLPTAPPPSRTHLTVRAQAAVVRTLLDEVERLSASAHTHASDQLVEELARLGRRVLEVAAAMTDTPSEESLTGAA